MTEKYSLYDPFIQNQIIEFSRVISELCGQQVILEAKYPEPITPETIIQHVSRTLNVPVKLIMGKSRFKDELEAGQIATVLIHNRFKWPYKKTGQCIKYKPMDHSSVMHRLKQHEDFMQSDKAYNRKFQMCRI